jgi:hypothetical protein
VYVFRPLVKRKSSETLTTFAQQNAQRGHRSVVNDSASACFPARVDDCDLSYGLIVGSDVCIDGLTTLRETLPLRPLCRSCIIATCGYDFRKGQVPSYVVMLSYCLGISRGNPERNTA